jgi:hypothetical protein
VRDGIDLLERISATGRLSVGWQPARASDRLGHPAGSVYVETFWLPLVGPSAVLALRRLSAWLEHEPDGITVSIAMLSSCLGLGTGTGRRAPVARTLARLVDFKHASHDGERLLLRRELPMLSVRQIERLPACLITAHEQLIQGSTRGIDQASAARQSDLR